MILRQEDEPLQSKDKPPEVDNTGDSRCTDNFYIFAFEHLRRNPLRGKQLGFLAMLADIASA